jgi:Pyruvate phosphate dikinase, AMP/ATP-binding domain
MTDKGFDKNGYEKLLYEQKERLKELACINQTNQFINEGKSLDETLQQICMLLPKAWQYPEHTVSRIIFENKKYLSPNFKETEWHQIQKFTTFDNAKGQIEVYYTKQFKEIDEGPFLKEERDLITNLATIVSNYINSLQAKVILEKTLEGEKKDTVIPQIKDSKINSRQLLQKFLNKFNANRDIFHDLMPFKVKEILLVATLYDAFSIENEGRFSEHILGEYHQLNLTSMPRITGVSSIEEAFDELKNKHFDMVIIMVGNDKRTPIKTSQQVKEKYPYIPIYVLLNNNQEISIFKESSQKVNTIDRIFVWNGDSKIFFAMVKHLEDKVNIENDAKVGLVKVILLVEDSEKYYSRYLPLLYNSVMDQTRRIIEDVSTDDLYKVLRLRARPKIILASTYEEALDAFHKHQENLLCLISDVKFKYEGVSDEEAGFKLVKHMKTILPELPVVIQSSDISNAEKAYKLKSIFINKNSESLMQDIKSFISHYLGFGNFVYKNASGRKIAEAKSLKEFERRLDTIPAESLVYHGKRNHFSLWLTARGEIKIAKMINPVKVNDFKSNNEFREYMKYVIRKYRNEGDAGKVVNFEEMSIQDDTNIVSLGSGALGGKGRGLAFVNTLIYNLNFGEIIPDIHVKTPNTLIIGTDEFDLFLDRNHLNEKIYTEYNYDAVKKMFLDGVLSTNLTKKLKTLLKHINKPLAVRSSSLFEDSTMQPFSGIFETYLLPNNHDDFHIRYKQLSDAVKLVYASIFSSNARTYFEAVNYKIEEEKMAIVIQEVVGNEYDGYFYPHISGTAQSHNYYPVAHMKPEDGFAVGALGLGKYVVEGEKTYRFSPKYPTIDIISNKDLFKSSQVHFYAVDLHKKDIDLLKFGEDAGLATLDIYDAEKHNTIKHIASVYDPENDRIEAGISAYGPRIINFANILKYEYIPLSKTLQVILDVVKEALGSPVEIEFAVDLNKDSSGRAKFYLLQIKPLLGTEEDFRINVKKVDEEKLILFTNKSMGNGKIDHITDVIFSKVDQFNKLKTMEMADEIEKLNKMMLAEHKQYILLGPGRWGTRDKFIGIPVAWPQISNAKVIVEVGLEDFPLDASLGSHFFHNVTSMNVGYFSVQLSAGTDKVYWEKLENQKVINETKYFKHVQFEEPLEVIMDGRKRVSVIKFK